MYTQEEGLASDTKKSSAEYQEFTSYTLHDIYSNQVKSGSFNGSSAEIDISTLKKGIYILNLQTGSENITKKIAVQ
ncbi:T9SS type A sorting domain-containing protein [Flavobacterium qiangtangense]|uniref:T9SS type A sorting domain-containing protein n=1 Tax=Flavobacterium qiangtangense TaxID=1442595 RepID=A0ABW1PHK8_9FLAO